MDVKTNYVVNDHNKPTKFEGFHFKCWRQNVLFFLTTKKIATNSTSKMSSLLNQPAAEQFKLYQTWTDNDFLCKKYMLNGL